MLLRSLSSKSTAPVVRAREGVGPLGIALAVLLAGPLASPAADAASNAGESHWPQWRGPHANGLATKGNPPVTWSETQNVKWKVKLPGRGASTPIIWGDQIFIQAAIPTGRKVEPPAADKPAAALAVPQVFGQAQAPAENPPADGQGQRRRRPGGGGFGGRGEKPTEVQQFVLLSLDRATGRIRWQQTAREAVPHEGHHRDHGFASHSPVTDGRHVYAWFGSRGLHCYDLQGGLKWGKDFGQQRTANSFGEGGSPALFGQALIVNWDHEGEDFIAAFDKTSGRELWRTARDEKTTWTTPFVVVHGGVTQVVVCATQRIRSYDLATGRQLWECGGLFANVIPTPVTGHGLLYATSGHRGNALLAIKLGQSGDLTDSPAIAWRHAKGTPYVPSPLLYDDKLYCFSGNNAILSCYNARSGEILFAEQRLDGPSGYYASPVGASGRVYLAGRNGVTVVLANSGQYEVLATNKLDEKFDASPAIVGNQLFLRGHEYLYCLAAD